MGTVVDGRRQAIKKTADVIRQKLQALHLDNARALAYDQTAKREANRFWGGVYDLLGTIETRSNTLEPKDLDALEEALRDLVIGIMSLERTMTNGRPTLTASDFRCDSSVRHLLALRRPWFAWVPDDSPWFLKILRNTEREFVPNRAWLVIFGIVLLAVETTLLLWEPIKAMFPDSR